MKTIISFIIIIFLIIGYVRAGDDASGSIPCSVDLSKPFEVYQMTSKDKLWSISLAKNLNF